MTYETAQEIAERMNEARKGGAMNSFFPHELLGRDGKGYWVVMEEVEPNGELRVVDVPGDDKRQMSLI